MKDVADQPTRCLASVNLVGLLQQEANVAGDHCNIQKKMITGRSKSIVSYSPHNIQIKKTTILAILANVSYISRGHCSA